jgi:AcrR family transcriptional regulator
VTGAGQPPKRGRPRSTGAGAAILRAFFEVVAEAGYAGATMDTIAERAGVAKTTIYRRWATKEQLMVAAHSVMLQEHPFPDTGTLRGDLMAFMQIVTETLAQWPLNRVAAATIGEMAHNEEVARIFREAVLEQRIALVGAMFDRAVARGEVAEPLDRRLCAQMLMGPIIVRVVITGESADMTVGAAVVEGVLKAVGAVSRTSAVEVNP